MSVSSCFFPIVSQPTPPNKKKTQFVPDGRVFSFFFFNITSNYVKIFVYRVLINTLYESSGELSYTPEEENMQQVFRKEIKYRISIIQYAQLERQLSRIMKKDSFSGPDGYPVRSLYFDSVYNQDLHDVLNGHYSKKKIRLRIYSPKDTKAKLELKVKHGLDQQKYSLTVSRDQAQELARGNIDFLAGWNTSVAQYIYREMRIGIYRPAVLIEYDRIAYVSAINKIRVTFDTHVRSSDCNFDLFTNNPNFTPLMPDDTGVLEVKYDHFLLSYIKEALACIDQLPQANSKYVLGRLRCY